MKKALVLVAVLALVGTATAGIQLFWSTTGMSGANMYSTAETNFLPGYALPTPVTGDLAPGTYDLTLWGRITDTDYFTTYPDGTQIYGLDLALAGTAGVGPNVAYRHKKTGAGPHDRWDGSLGILLPGVMAAVTSDGIQLVPWDNNDLYEFTTIEFLIGGAQVTGVDGDSLTASTSVDVWNIDAKSTADGKSVTNRAGSVTTYTQTFYSEGIQIAKVGESFTHTPNDTASASVGEYKVTLRVTNFGSNDVYIPLNTLATTSASAGSTKGVAFGITDGTTATSTSSGVAIPSTLARVSGGVEKTNAVLISGGQTADFTLTATFNPDAGYGTTAKQFRVQVWSMGHATTDTATAATIVSTTPTEDFRTAFYTINN